MVAGLFGFYELVAGVWPLIDLPPALAALKVPKVPLPWAAVIVLVAALFVVLEGSYCIHLGRNEEAQSSSSTEPDVNAKRPLVVPVRYGKSELNRHGLFVRNDGDPAFDVSIENANIGTSILRFWNDFPGLTKDDGEVLLEASVELDPAHGLLGNGLGDEIVRQAIDAIDVPIRYKNADKAWYVTTCKLERDFLHGIRAGYTVQQTLSTPHARSEPLSIEILECYAENTFIAGASSVVLLVRLISQIDNPLSIAGFALSITFPNGGRETGDIADVGKWQLICGKL